MADKVKEVAKEEADRIKSLTVEAARSAAYLYPLRVCSSYDCSETFCLSQRRSLYLCGITSDPFASRVLHIFYHTETYGVQ